MVWGIIDDQVEMVKHMVGQSGGGRWGVLAALAVAGIAWVLSPRRVRAPGETR